MVCLAENVFVFNESDYSNVAMKIRLKEMM